MSNSITATDNPKTGNTTSITGKIVDFLSPKPGDDKFNETGFKEFKFKVRGHNSILAHGKHIPPARTGDSFSLIGQYTYIEGRLTFEVFTAKKNASSVKPSYDDAAFLADNIAGIGPKMAEAIVAALGKDTIKQLQEDPELIYGVPNLNDAMKRSVLIYFGAENHALVNTFKFLQGFCGFPRSTAWKIWRQYHDSAEKQIRSNPYILLSDIIWIHFDDVDQIAMKLGIKRDDEKRITAAIMYTLIRAIYRPEEGHSFLDFTTLRSRVIDKLGACLVSGRKVNKQIDKLCEDGTLYRCKIPGTDREAIYTASEYIAETAIASRLSIIAEKGSQKLLRLNSLIPTYLDPSQKEAVLMALKYDLSLVCGAAGTGKTTILRTILGCLKVAGYDKDTEILLCAYTGKAAKRIEETTGSKASTIHRALVWKRSGGFMHGASNPLPEKVYIIDEASMLTNVLFYDLLNAIPEGSKIILIGDAHQLPPIGGGNLLRELRRSKKIKCTILKNIHRQEDERNEIVEASQAILENRMPVSGESFEIKYVPDDQAGVELFIETLLESGIENTIGLSPLRRYNYGVDYLNNLIQEKVNPQSPGKEELRIGQKRKFRTGDPVIHTRNNYELNVMNGAIGKVVSCNAEEKSVTVEYQDAIEGTRDVIYDYDLARFQLDLAYATTAYKIQGSERDRVVIFLPQSAYSLNTRNSLYTMVTRGKQHVTLIGMKSTIADCIKNDTPSTRNTMLAHRINHTVAPGNIRDPEVDNN